MQSAAVKSKPPAAMIVTLSGVLARNFRIGMTCRQIRPRRNQ
jgi:hypothetical protein